MESNNLLHLVDYLTDSVIVEFDPSLISKQKRLTKKSGYKFVRIATREGGCG